MRTLVTIAGALILAAVFFFWLAGQVGGIISGVIALVLILVARPWRAGRRTG